MMHKFGDRKMWVYSCPRCQGFMVVDPQDGIDLQYDLEGLPGAPSFGECCNDYMQRIDRPLTPEELRQLAENDD